MWTIKEYAEKMGVHYMTVDGWVRSGKLGCVQPVARGKRFISMRHHSRFVDGEGAVRKSVDSQGEL